jgi:hypothetical protein
VVSTDTVPYDRYDATSGPPQNCMVGRMSVSGAVRLYRLPWISHDALAPLAAGRHG